jgi:hypothetical protein
MNSVRRAFQPPTLSIDAIDIIDEKESPLKKPSFCLFFSFRNLAEK